ncbi:hypothetical protein [Pararhizobium sp. DWP3-4]|uniref:hypothetical protein n=1 Tax=Pararhizobium sp. DWP3-4 TaxID=2804565 RepID=UPI003CE78B2F
MIKGPKENLKDDDLERQETLEPSFLAIHEAVNLWFEAQAFPDDPTTEKNSELPAVGSFS